MGNYTNDMCKVGLRKEPSTYFRQGRFGTFPVAVPLGLADVLTFDLIDDEAFEIPKQKLVKEKQFEIGGDEMPT